MASAYSTSPLGFRRGDILTAVSLCAILASSPAMAQSESSSPQRSANAAYSDGSDIVVTARRREELVQNVPLSIQAFSGKTLQQSQVLRVSDLSQVVPGLNFQTTAFGNSNLSVAVRGQRQGLGNIAYDPGVSVYFNEVVQARTQGLNDAFYDIANVQVLKGPQGTLFGRNTTGGAILIESRKPTDRFEGYLTGSLGSYATRRLDGAVNLPVSDALQFRFAGAINRRGGVTNSPANGRRVDNVRNESWRVSVRLAPTDVIENNFVVYGTHEHDDGAVYKTIFAAPGTTAANAGLGAEVALLATLPFRTTNATVPTNGTQITTLGISNITELDVSDELKVKNIFGYRKVDSHIYADVDGGSPVVFNAELFSKPWQVSDELQLLGSALNGRLDFVLGLYYFREKGAEDQYSYTAAPNSNPANAVTAYQVISKSYAAYAQGTFKATDTVSLTGGLRYTKDERYFASHSFLLSGVCRLFEADSGTTPLSPCFRDASASFKKPTYNLSVDWKFAENNLLYAAHRFGYQGGGFTNSARRPSEFAPYRPQTVNDYEIGLKSQWSAGMVVGRTNVAGFIGKYKDIQRLRSFFVLGTNNQLVAQNKVENAGSATVQGIELEQTLDFNHLLQLSAAYSYLDAHYDSFFIGTDNYTNSRFAGAPKHSLSVSARLTPPHIPRVGDLSAKFGLSYQSETVVADVTSFNAATQTGRPTSVLPAYTLFNARIDLDKVADTPLRLSAYVTNLFNKNYYVGGIDSSPTSGYVARQLGLPRIVALEASIEF